MSTVRAIRESGLARLGTYSLIILWYVIYTMGTLLQVGLGRIADEPPVVQIGGATVAFVVGLALIRWFFESQSG